MQVHGLSWKEKICKRKKWMILALSKLVDRAWSYVDIGNGHCDEYNYSVDTYKE